MKNIHIIVEGRVQKVGYRRFVVSVARNLDNISGWVRNLENGDVEILASGEENKLNQLIFECKKGPSFSKVINLTVSDIRNDEIDKFFEPITTKVFKAIL